MEKKLPKGWVETELGNYAVLKNGFAYKTAQFKEVGIPILKISNITKNGKVDLASTQYVDESEYNESFVVRNGDIVIAMSGATTGKFGIYNLDKIVLQNQRVGNLKLHDNKLGNKRFLYYIIASLKEEIEGKAYGGAQPNISSTLIESIKMLLPPLTEQERIANKLDELFGRLEVIKASMEKIPQLLKDFRQQVLTSAVTGKLTEEWREGKAFDYRKIFSINELSSKLGSGATPKGGSEVYQNEGIPLVRSMNVVFWGIKKEGLVFISDKQAEALKNVEIKPNDILLNITGASIGRVCIADECVIGGRVNQHVFIIRVKEEKVLPTFLNIYLSSPRIQKFINDENYGVTRQSITKTQIGDILIEIPLLVEQEEIVSRVESLFAKADKIEEQYVSLKKKIDVLPQLLLHKAFKGELVEQLPTDGDAADLLKEIMALKKHEKK